MNTTVPSSDGAPALCGDIYLVLGREAVRPGSWAAPFPPLGFIGPSAGRSARTAPD